VTYLDPTYNINRIFMKLNNKLNKAKKYKLDQEKLRNNALSKGVNLIAPDTIFLSKDTKFGKNVTVEPYVVIGSKVKIGSNVVIKSFSHIEDALMESNVVVGPYARLRPGTILKSGVKIGNFVEVKKSKIGKSSKVSHLSYVGDTIIGKNSNIGAWTITCNYDGSKKHKTSISENVFIGSNTSLVAPVKIGKNSTVGAGSVITRNVKKNSLVLTRSKQQEIKNYKRKK
jgi:bifunctional UDP-N-acetylglucosamine pyrophosphorylase/glucosamine-1-phosphate N-acetyltransferase